MLRTATLISMFYLTSAYFTLPGKCPENISVQQDFKLADFFDKWYQVYHYSSNGQNQSNCSVIELQTQSTGIHVNFSRVDRGLFHRFSIGRVEIPIKLDDAALMNVSFFFKDAPRRLMTRIYPFRVLATNYKYYATVYTCGYSSLIDKHFVYVWILSRKPTLNEVSKELALKPLHQLGIKENDLAKDDFTKCTPKYYEDKATEPVTFKLPVPI